MRRSDGFDRDPESGLFLPKHKGGKIMHQPQELVGPTFFSSGVASDPFWADVYLLWLADEGLGAPLPIDRSVNMWTMTPNSCVASTTVLGPFGQPTWRAAPGSGRYITSLHGAGTDFDSMTNFTFESWMYADSGAADLTLACGSAGIKPYYAQMLSGTVYVGDSVTNNITVAMTVPSTTWQHYALVKEGVNWSFYQHGVRLQTTTTGLLPLVMPNIHYGGRADNSCLIGYYGGVRITSNVARYSGASFAVPTAPWPVG